MQKTELLIENKTIFVFQSHLKQPENTIFYTFPDSETEADALAALLPENTILVAIMEHDWEQHFTPWAAPRLFKKGADFGGGALAYHTHLAAHVIPQIETESGFQAAFRGILGYSLAGLFALYGATVAPYFDGVACVSGSLWFDDWLDFMYQHTPSRLPRAVYFSLGDTEANSKNLRMAQVQSATEQTVAHWQQLDVPVRFDWNTGSHFDDVPQRLAKAAAYLAKAA